MIAQAAFGRAAGQAVLDAVADEGVRLAVVHADRHADDHGALRFAQAFENVDIELHVLGDGEQLQDRHLIDGRVAVNGARQMMISIHSVASFGRGEEFAAAGRPTKGSLPFQFSSVEKSMPYQGVRIQRPEDLRCAAVKRIFQPQPMAGQKDRRIRCALSHNPPMK